MNNCNIITPILWGFCILIAWVIGYFFVYKQNQADRDYEKKMKELGYIGNGWF
jgi:hypothetical protein